MTSPLNSRVFVAACLVLALTGCNAGLGAVISSSGDTSDSDAPTNISSFSVEGSQESPATLRFRLVDGNGGASEVSLFYQVDGATPELVTQLVGQPNPALYEASPGGVEHVLSWDFVAEPGIASGGNFVPDVTVFASLVPGDTTIAQGANAATIGIGNDAPVVTAPIVPSAELGGVIPIAFDVSDSSSDTVDVRIEFDLLNDAPDAGWRLARPSFAAETPEFAIVDFATDDTGVQAAFFWETAVDLANGEDDVVLRITPVDAVTEGKPLITPPFVSTTTWRRRHLLTTWY